LVKIFKESCAQANDYLDLKKQYSLVVRVLEKVKLKAGLANEDVEMILTSVRLHLDVDESLLESKREFFLTYSDPELDFCRWLMEKIAL
jgi:hypothetical protein